MYGGCIYSGPKLKQKAGSRTNGDYYSYVTILFKTFMSKKFQTKNFVEPMNYYHYKCSNCE